MFLWINYLCFVVLACRIRGMKYLSLFSGIGGFELGIQQAYELQKVGTKSKNRTYSKSEPSQHWKRPLCIGYSEIDKYATQIYQKHFPNHKNYGDITKIKTEDLPDFELLVGGFPCQSFSIAGKRLGFQDTRGTMFFEIARIIVDKKPSLLLLENVKGLLSHDEGRTFETIIWTLDELGYDLQWQVLNSKNFGVPQNRERVFIIGHLRGTSRPKVFPITADGREDHELPRYIANTLTARYEGAQATGTYIGESELNAQEAEPSRSGVLKKRNKPDNSDSRGGKTHPASVRRQPLKFLKRNQKNIDGDYAFTLDSANTGGVKIDSKIRRLTPKECARLQGFPDDWCKDLSDTQAYKCYGNAVTVNVIEAIISKLIK